MGVLKGCPLVRQPFIILRVPHELGDAASKLDLAGKHLGDTVLTLAHQDCIDGQGAEATGVLEAEIERAWDLGLGLGR